MVERNRKLSEIYAVAVLVLWLPEGVIIMATTNRINALEFFFFRFSDLISGGRNIFS